METCTALCEQNFRLLPSNLLFALPPSLKQVELSGLSFTAEASLQAFCQLLHHSNLQSLAIVNCTLSGLLADVLVEGMRRTPSLSIIHFPSLSVPNFPPFLHAFARHLPHMAIKELYF